MSSLNNLLRIIESGSLIGNLQIPDGEIIEFLNRRDSEEFSRKWMDTFLQIEKAKFSAGLNEANENSVAKVRELSYLQTFKRWNSSDLAGYISDDFGLIGDALSIDANDLWVNGLLQWYLEGMFPNDVLLESEIRLSTQI